MSEVLGFISDGYTERGTVAAVPGIYPAVKLTWRPMLIEQLVAYYKASEKASALQLRQICAKLLADHIVTWDLKDARGGTVPVSVASMLRLKDRLFNRLFGVVSTQEAPDSLPEDDEELAAAADDLLKATQGDQSPVEVREARERKNS